MRHAIAATLAVILALPAAAQDTDAIEGAIDGQLDAFVARDVDTAFGFASPMIRGMFGTAENFGAMVENGYPMVWNNDEARFTALQEAPGGWMQRVTIRDADGAIHVLEYRMIETSDGWRIDGVSVLPAPDVGV